MGQRSWGFLLPLVSKDNGAWQCGKSYPKMGTDYGMSARGGFRNGFAGQFPPARASVSLRSSAPLPRLSTYGSTANIRAFPGPGTFLLLWRRGVRSLRDTFFVPVAIGPNIYRLRRASNNCAENSRN